jgi:hypothetical protein
MFDPRWILLAGLALPIVATAANPGVHVGYPQPPTKPFDPKGPQTGHGDASDKIRAAWELRLAIAREEADNARRQAQEQRRREQARLAADPFALRAEYAGRIRQVVQSAWNDYGTGDGARCTVVLVKAKGGAVQDVGFAQCDYDASTRDRLASQLRAITLPYAGFESVFETRVTFTFCCGTAPQTEVPQTLPRPPARQ